MSKAKLVMGALFTTFLWGSAFPCVKNGQKMLQISSADIGSQMLYAGIRFLLAGIAVIMIASIGSRRVLLPRKKEGVSFKSIIVLALAQTFIQYFFYYIGIAHVTGAKSSIVNSIGTLFAVVLGMIYFKTKPSVTKSFGVILGFAGVIYMCMSGFSGSFTFVGEGLLIMSGLSSAVANIINKQTTKNANPMLVTGWHLTLGGGGLLLVGIIMNGHISITSFKAVLLIGYMIFISAGAFSMWTYLLKYNKVEDVAVFKFFVPIFGTILSGIFLGEKIGYEVILALVLVCIGIVLTQIKLDTKG